MLCYTPILAKLKALVNLANLNIKIKKREGYPQDSGNNKRTVTLNFFKALYPTMTKIGKY